MKLIKWLLWLVLFLLVIAVGGAIFLVTKVDPNEYKPQISQKVESLTGRKLTLGGDISWRFYPWVGVTLNDFSLSNREGFAPENMIEATQVDVQLKVLPLLSKQLEIGKIDLQSPKINLSVDAQGVTNWDDLSENGAADAPKIEKPEQAAGAMLGGLVVQGVDISQGEIGWNDQAAGQSYQLSDFNLSTGIIEPGLPVDFDLNSGVSGTGLPADAQLSLKGSLLLNEAMDGLQLENLVTRLNMDKIQAGLELAMLTFSLADGELAVLDIQAEGSNEEAAAKLNIDTLSYGLGSQLAALGKLTFSAQYEQFPIDGELNNMRFDINSNTLSVATHALDSKYNDLPVALAGKGLLLDLNKETLVAPGLVIKLDDAVLDVQLEASQLMGDVQARGHLVSNQFNPDVLVTKLGLDVLSDMPEQAMQTLLLETDFTGGLSGVEVSNLKLALDQSTLTGGFSMQDFEKPAYRFDVNLDRINVDDYLSEGKSANDPASKPAANDAAVQDAASTATAPVAQGTLQSTAGVTALPFAELKGLDVKGQIKIGELRVSDLLSNDVLVKVDTEADRIAISPLSARVYGGETVNSVVYDISGDAPIVEIDSELLSLNMGSFLQAMQISDRLEGIGTVMASITSTGMNEKEAISNLNGQIDINLNDGAIRGVDLQGALIKAEAMVKQLSGKDLGLSAELGDKTEFSEFGSDIKINKGVMTIRNIKLLAPAIRVSGGGLVDLNTEQLDLKLDISIVGSFEGQGGASLDTLKGQTIPMKITGALASPSILPDLNKILQKELERKVTEKYLGEGESGESLEDALNRKLNEKLAKETGQGTQEAASGTVVEGASQEDAVDSAPTEAADDQLTDKQKLRKELKKEGAKLLQGLFGN